METLILDSTDPVSINNLVSYERFSCQPRWKVTKMIDEVPGEEYYFFFDCPGDDAFAHWVYESFIFYPLLLEKFKEYPTLKILTSNKKKYVRNMLNFINVYSPIVSEVTTTKNIVFFPPIFAINHPNMELFIKYFENYSRSIKVDTITPIGILYLPRNTKENYINNDRPEPLIPAIKDVVLSKGGTVIDTYDINNMRLQLAVVQASEVIILHWGSAFYFNCAHLRGKTIILLDSFVNVQQLRTQPFYRSFMQMISNNNKVVSVFSYVEDLLKILDNLY